MGCGLCGSTLKRQGKRTQSLTIKRDLINYKLENVSLTTYNELVSLVVLPLSQLMFTHNAYEIAVEFIKFQREKFRYHLHCLNKKAGEHTSFFSIKLSYRE